MNVPESQPRPRPFSKHFWLVLGAVVAIAFAIVVTLALSPDCNGIKQAINMRKARRHIDAISPQMLSATGRSHVEMTEYTAGPCGCLLVRGQIAGVDNAERLRGEIAATNPPVAVLFQLEPEDPTSPLIRLESIPASKPTSKPVSK